MAQDWRGDHRHRRRAASSHSSRRRSPSGDRERRRRRGSSRDRKRGGGRCGGEGQRRDRDRGGASAQRGRGGRRRRESRSRTRTRSRSGRRGGRRAGSTAKGRRGGGGSRRRRRNDDSRSRSRSRKPAVASGRHRRGAGCGSRGRGSNGSRSDSASASSATGSGDSGAAGDDGGKKSGGDSNKDEIVHFSWTRGQQLDSRYKLVKLLGDGTFGRVLLAEDQRQAPRQVAIKVIRDIKRYAENAEIEADILKDIAKRDPKGEASRSAIMYDCFHHGRHYCLVFEPCGSSLYDFLRKNTFRGFWMQDIQNFAHQSLSALAFLHDKMRLTHTDLKPENILLESMAPAREAEYPRLSTWKPSAKRKATEPYVRPASSAIRLIDFGNATYEDEHHSSVINTRQYRGPEVILSLGWNERSDVWSTGCILMELYTGELLFGTHENTEHLALMERILGPVPAAMLEGAPREAKDKYVKNGGGAPALNWPEGAPTATSERHVRSQRPLRELLATEQHSEFASFVGCLLTLDPARRPSAKEAMHHKFFSESYSD